MPAVRRDGAVRRAAGPRWVHEAEREERVSQGLPLAPGPAAPPSCWASSQSELMALAGARQPGHGGDRSFGSAGEGTATCSHLQPPAWHDEGPGGVRTWGHGVAVARGWCWDPAALGRVAQGGLRSPPVPHFRLTPASPVEIIHAPSGSGLVWPCRAHQQPYLLVQ